MVGQVPVEAREEDGRDVSAYTYKKGSSVEDAAEIQELNNCTTQEWS